MVAGLHPDEERNDAGEHLHGLARGQQQGLACTARNEET